MEKTEYQEEKHAKFIYSSKRRIQWNVLNLEKQLAAVIYNFIQNDVQIENNKNFVFKGHAWIALASDLDKEWKVAVFGHFTINATGKRLRRYTLKFYDNDQVIVLFK